MSIPPKKAAPPDKDASDLRTLSIAWYVYAALTGCGALAMLAGTLIAAFTTSYVFQESGQTGFPICVTVFAVLPTLVMGLLTVNAFAVARYLPARVGYGTCFCSSILHAILFIPLGTILGVFTIMVISRDSIKPTFRDDD